MKAAGRKGSLTQTLVSNPHTSIDTTGRPWTLLVPRKLVIIKKGKKEVALGSPSNSPRRCWVPLYLGVLLAADPLVPGFLCSPPSSPPENIARRLLKSWTCVFSICVFIYSFHIPRPKQRSKATVNYHRVYPLLLDQSTVHDSVEPRWCRGVIWTLSSSSPSIRSHSSRKMRTLRRGVQLRRLWSWLVLASIPPETISNCARESLQEPQSGERKEGRSAYGLLGSEVRGIGGHGLGGLNLLLDNGRHLPLDQYSTHSIPLKFQSIPWLNYLRICLFCRASARWCEV